MESREEDDIPSNYELELLREKEALKAEIIKARAEVVKLELEHYKVLLENAVLRHVNCQLRQLIAKHDKNFEAREAARVQGESSTPPPDGK